MSSEKGAPSMSFGEEEGLKWPCQLTGLFTSSKANGMHSPGNLCSASGKGSLTVRGTKDAVWRGDAEGNLRPFSRKARPCLGPYRSCASRPVPWAVCSASPKVVVKALHRLGGAPNTADREPEAPGRCPCC